MTPTNVNDFRKYILLPVKSAMPESKGERKAIRIYTAETEKEYSAVLAIVPPKKGTSGRVTLEK
jgi:hypothetical protein